jgi:hypothetical protein
MLYCTYFWARGLKQTTAPYTIHGLDRRREEDDDELARSPQQKCVPRLPAARFLNADKPIRNCPPRLRQHMNKTICLQ